MGIFIETFPHRGRQACLTEIVTSEIQKVCANKLMVNKVSVELLRL